MVVQSNADAHDMSPLLVNAVMLQEIACWWERDVMRQPMQQLDGAPFGAQQTSSDFTPHLGTYAISLGFLEEPPPELNGKKRIR